MSGEIVNKVAASGLITLDLETWFPGEPIRVFDLKPFLFMEMILKEKDFRAALQEQDWENFRGLTVTVTCSADAIIPMWAYMLVTTYLEPVAAAVYYGTEAETRQAIFLDRLKSLDPAEFQDKKIVVKGCGDLPIGEAAYLEITRKLRGSARSIMYGEPCSTVPIFKRK